MTIHEDFEDAHNEAMEAVRADYYRRVLALKQRRKLEVDALVRLLRECQRSIEVYVPNDATRPNLADKLRDHLTGYTDDVGALEEQDDA